MAKNPAAKARKTTDLPYLTIVRGGWTWKVLKFWQGSGQNAHGRAFCHVITDMTGPSGDLGDVYVDDLRYALRQGGKITQFDGISPAEVTTLLGISDHAFNLARVGQTFNG